MYRRIFATLFIALFFYNYCFAQTSASQMERAQEILRKEEALRNKLREPDKVFIRNIVVKGITLLTNDKIKEIVSPFLKHWLTPLDIQQIEEYIKQAYKE